MRHRMQNGCRNRVPSGHFVWVAIVHALDQEYMRIFFNAPISDRRNDQQASNTTHTPPARHATAACGGDGTGARGERRELENFGK